MTFIATMKVRLAVALTFVAALLTGANLSYGQVRVSDYQTETFSVKEYVTAPKELSGPSDNDISTYSLPFAFTYDGIDYEEGHEIKISPNGWFSFAKEVNQKITSDIVGDESVPEAISLLSNDMAVSTGIFIGVEGESPDRIFTIELRDLRHTEVEKPTFHVQAKLYETSNVIEILYSEHGMEINGKAQQGIGLNGHVDKFSFLRYGEATTTTPEENIRFTPSKPKPSEPMLTIAPTSHDFGELRVLNSLTTCFTVSNTGTPAEPGGEEIRLVISGLSFSNNASDYSIISSSIPKEGLAIGESAEICVMFTPIGVGQRSSALMITSNDTEDPEKGFSLSGVGIAPLVSVDKTELFKNKIADVDDSLTQSFTVTNTGSFPLSVLEINITGEYRDQYEILNPPTEPIAPGESVEVTVLYIARYEGRLPSELSVVTDAYVNPIRTIRLWGQGVQPRMSASVTYLSFDSVSIGDTVKRTITISNPGSDTLKLLRNGFVSADLDFFYEGLGNDSLIAPGNSRNVVVGFAPRTRGTRLARLLLDGNLRPTFTEPPVDTSELYIDIRGIGVPSGELYVGGLETVDSVSVGTEQCHTITLENIGLADLTVQNISFTGSEFSLSGATFPIVVPAQGTRNITICATPSAAGMRTADLTVTAMSSEKLIVQTLPVSVFGIERCVSADLSNAFANIVRIGKSSSEEITITNCGNVTGTFSATITEGNVTYSLASAIEVTLAPTESHTFAVNFTPNAFGTQLGTLTITAEGFTPEVVTLNGVGGATQLSTQTIVVPPTQVGSSNTFEVIVTNNGNVDWTPGALSIAPSTEYTMESSPATISANGGTGTFVFRFAPTDDGTHNAAVTFPAGDQTSAFSFNLNGALSSVKNGASNGYVLSQNYPNPFNPSTNLLFTTPVTGYVKITVMDMAGNEVAVIADGVYEGGSHPVKFDASQLASGAYIYQLVADGVRLERTMILNK